MPESKNKSTTEEDPLEIEIEIDFGDFEDSEEENKNSPEESAATEGEVVPEQDTSNEAEVVPEDEVVPEAEIATEAEVEPEEDASSEAEVAPEDEQPNQGVPLDDIAAAISASIGELMPENEGVSLATEDLSSPVSPRQTEPTTIKSADSLNFRLVGIKTWKVKVKIGLVYDFSDIKTLHKYIKDGRVTNEDTISHNGKEWTTIGDIPDLEAHFIKVYLEAEKSAPPAKNTSPLISGNNNEESSLTSEIMDQITQESLNAVESAPATGPEFVDPFAELKSKQKSRLKQRDGIRSMHKEAANSDSSAKTKKAVLVLMLAALALYIILPKGDPETTPTVVAAEATAENNAVAPEVVEDSRTALDAAINQRLQDIQAEAEAEEEAEEPQEEVRIYVQPTAPSQQQGSPIANQQNESPRQAAAPTGQLISRGSPATRARDAYLNQDWSAARDAYTQAFNTTRDPRMILGIGKSLFRLGNFRGAEEKLLAADQAGAMDQEGLRFLAQIYIDRGDPMGANTYQQRLQ